MPSTQLKHSRQLAINRQRERCYYCGPLMCLESTLGPRPLLCTAEHLLPRHDGGSDDPSNIVAACLHCNKTRHRKKVPPDPASYKAEVLRRLMKGRWHPREVLAWSASRASRPA